MLLLLAACGPRDVTGAAAKGPLLLGSPIQVSETSADGVPSGSVYVTQTTSDLGDFELSISYGGTVRIEAEGYAWDEVAGDNGAAPVTLRALADLGTSSTVYVNTVTHLAHDRVATLLADGSNVEDATAQAEDELQAATGVGPAGFDPGAAGTTLDLAQLGRSVGSAGDVDGDGLPELLVGRYGGFFVLAAP